MDNRLHFLMLVIFIFYSCERPELISPAGFEIDMEDDTVIFAQIGDYGYAGEWEEKVAGLVNSWNPDLIISVGDNNYNNGKLSTIKSNIANYYGDYIYNFDAPSAYRCKGKAYEERINRFFPTPGNHDGDNRDGLIPYYNFFTLPGNEIYYKFVWGPVTFYSINCIDGSHEEQISWLTTETASSASAFNIVFFHYPPYCSGSHGDTPSMQWDFYSMGIDVLFSGHDHVYQRISKKDEEGMYYVINGLGGKATGGCVNPLPSESFSSFCYGDNYGAVRCVATIDELVLEFFEIGNPEIPVDRMVITAEP